ncbi:hypothetical protein KY284_019996 [Solanum tuberosum]|nr:hypothetical protein KY284_019996 [Solanum tuberosum]
MGFKVSLSYHSRFKMTFIFTQHGGCVAHLKRSIMTELILYFIVEFRGMKVINDSRKGKGLV